MGATDRPSFAQYIRANVNGSALPAGDGAPALTSLPPKKAKRVMMWNQSRLRTSNFGPSIFALGVVLWELTTGQRRTDWNPEFASDPAV